VSHLPFLFLEHEEFYDLISYARLAPTTPTIPSRKVIRTRLREFVTENQTTALRSLPPDAKLSLALDCWTSPFQQAFMAITAYFLDQNWDYRKVLLGFEPLSGTHSGANLSEVVVRTLQQHQILDRVLAITTRLLQNPIGPGPNPTQPNFGLGFGAKPWTQAGFWVIPDNSTQPLGTQLGNKHDKHTKIL
jgi:hypothetical protein